MNEETLFHLAVEKPPGERNAYLDSACGGNAELRSRVEVLLSAHDNPGSFLQQPALQSTGANPGQATQAMASGAASRAKGSTTPTEPAISSPDDLAFLTPSPRPDALGRLEHYDILEVIGKGGFGTVLRAFDEKLHRIVAIKVLSLELSASGTARQRFIREARTAAAVVHEHVVTIHAVVEEHRPPYLVMQMIDGVTLQQKLDRTGPLSLREILRIGMQMAQALDAAHKQGLVHRDIKPANILLENGVERVKITDFGLARAVDDASVTQSGTVAGTPMYMSPEQAEGLPVDHRSDLFSLGTVLYAMCTGQPPFRASGTHAVLKRVIDAAPRPVREINNEIPEWLEAIIAKLHAKKPDGRFQTAKEVGELLGQHLAHVQQPSMVARPFAVSLAAAEFKKSWHVGDQVLAPLVPEWLYVCKVLEVKEESVLVTFEGAHTAWVPTADVLPDDIGKDTRVLGFIGWMSGHHPGTVTERLGNQVHVLYDNGSSKWTKLNKIVVPTDKLAKPGTVVPIEPSNPNAIFESQVVAPPYIYHATRRSMWLGLLGMVLGAGAGVAIGLAYPRLVPWGSGEVNRDVVTFALWGGVIGIVLAMVLSTRLLMSDIRTRVGGPTDVAAPERNAVPLKTKFAEGAMIIAGIGVVFMAVALPTTTPAGLALAVAAGALVAAANIIMLMSLAPPWPWVKSAGRLAMIGLVGVLLGGIIVGFVRQGELPWQINRAVETTKPNVKDPQPGD